MKTGHRPIKGLGESALRVEDLDSMQLFYEQVVGLELIEQFEGAAFLKLGDGHGGHTQVLALFDRKGSRPGTPAWSHSRPRWTTSRPGRHPARRLSRSVDSD